MSKNIKFTSQAGTIQNFNNVDTIKITTLEGGVAIFRDEDFAHDATATTGDLILNSIIAYGKDDVRLVGTIPTKTDSDITSSGGIVTIPSGYYAQLYTKQGDPSGDATMTSGDQMLNGITAYSLGIKYTGTIETKTASDMSISTNTVTAPAGYYAEASSRSIDTTDITETSGSISGSSYTQGTVNVDTAGYITNGRKINGATFTNSATATTTYKDISATTAAPVLVTGDYLYINKGYTDDCKISLARLVPDGASADLASNKILSGYSAYNNDGLLIAGSLVDYDGSITIT